jgi:hypothetical protein
MKLGSNLSIVALLPSLLLLASCASADSSPPSESIPSAMKPSIPTTEAECVARRGNWSQQGLGGGPFVCDLQAKDAKVCTDAAHCEGECQVDKTVEVGTRAVGHCSEYLVSYGCRRFLEKGVVREICTD